MGNAYLWIKALHVVLVVGWFAGLLYLPRLYGHLAAAEEAATRDRLLLMARRLLGFMTGLGLGAVVLGMWLLGQATLMRTGWMQAKLVLVLVLIGYHAWCAVLYMRFEGGGNARSRARLRGFDEVPALLLAAIVALVIVKPF
jgi:putative membrane protein